MPLDGFEYLIACMAALGIVGPGVPWRIYFAAVFRRPLPFRLSENAHAAVSCAMERGVRVRRRRRREAA